MSGKPYVPKGIAAFCPWIVNLINYLVKNHERWGVPAPPEILQTEIPKLTALADKCAIPGHTDLDVASKNNLRRSVEKNARIYLQAVIMRNPAVTDDDRHAMGLPVRDRTRTPIGDPVGQADAAISYRGRAQLMLHIRHIEGTPSDPRANDGCRVYVGVYAPGATLPTMGNELHESRFVRRKKALFDFAQTDSGKTAVFCIRYENHKGKAGPWGPVFSAIIP